MTLEPGARLGSYEILSALGAGGMGEVYRARHVKLGRKVAIKVLPEGLTSDPERLRRFEREAQTASALNHPNIVTVYDIAEHEGITYIAMELVEGRTLRDLLREGRPPVSQVIALADQICAGLAEAHAVGIVHRDLKPDNLMVTPDDRVKILDFGLAKPVETGAALDSRMATLTKATGGGVILGTVHYLSPEQAAGAPIDHRSDQFSLGVVLYELLSGQRPFEGSAVSTVLSAILRDPPPPLRSLRSDIPKGLEKIVYRCLEKDPADRFASTEALREALLRAAPSPEARWYTEPAVRRGAWITAFVLLVAAGSWLWMRSSRIRWAREVALPQIERLADSMSWVREGTHAWSAFALAREAEPWIARDPLLERLWPRIAREVAIRSEPAGSTVFAKPYGTPEKEWLLLGRTPLETVQIPLGFARVMLEKDGYETVHDLQWVVDWVDTEEWSFELPVAGSIPPEMVRLPGGKGSLRMPGLEHLDSESVAPFLMDRYEVSNRDFQRFVDAGGYEREELWREPFVRDGRTIEWEEARTFFTDRTGRPGPASWEVGRYPEGHDDHPVAGVSWYEAAAYAAFAGKSLPTIFHWNRAAFTWSAGEVVRLANFDGEGPAAAGTRPDMNRMGTYHLAGNVREWCWNATSRRGQRFLLGGGWNDPTYAFAEAFAQSPWDRSPTNGFRCIRYTDTETNEAALTRTIELPLRDFLTEKPVSDETFQAYRSQYQYDRTELGASIDWETEQADSVLQKASFAAPYGNERMSAWVFLPREGRPPYQAVVYFPQAGAIHSRSSESFLKSESEYFGFLLKSGRAVVLPVLKSTLERGDELDSDLPRETSFYKEHVIMWVKDVSRTIDYLETRRDIDSDKLAYYGFSWGGTLGTIVPAVEQRFEAIVLYVGGLTFQPVLPEVDGFHYLPRITTPILMLNGAHDFIAPVETSQRPTFESLGTPAEHKRWVVAEGSHYVPRATLIRETLDWLDRYLGPVEKRQPATR